MGLVVIYKIERLDTGVGRLEGPTCFIRGAYRRGRYKFFNPGAVPPFEGDHAWFQIDRSQGRWEILRQVDPPPGRR